MRNTVWHRRVCGGVMVAASLLPTWSSHAQTPTSPGDEVVDVRAQLVDVPAPELVDVDQVVADQIAEARHQFDAEIATPGLSDERLAEAYGGLGQLYHAYELLDAAAPSYHNATLLAPNDARWRHLLADVLRQQGLPDAAAEQYLAAWALDPFDFAALVRLGEVQLEVGRLDEAEGAFRSALDLMPAAPSAMAGLGQVALARRDFGRAVTYLEAALRAVPAANRLHYNLAMAYRGLGEMDKAKQHLELRGTVGLKPPDPLLDELQELTLGERVHLVRGRMAFAAERYGEAAALFQKAVDAEPASVRSRVNLGTALARSGDTEGALEQYRKALELEPGDAVASFNLGSLLVESDRAAEAVGPLQTSVRANPNDAEARLLLARALVARGEDEASLEHYKRAAELDPSSENAVIGGAAALVRLDRFAIARSVLEAGHQRMPSSGSIAFSLARLLATCPDRDLRDGQRALELAYRIYNAAPTPRHAQLVAQSLAQLDRCEEAAEWQRQLVEAARQSGESEAVEALQTVVARYAAGSPCRE